MPYALKRSAARRIAVAVTLALVACSARSRAADEKASTCVAGVRV